jgi:hypothetical protein
MGTGEQIVNDHPSIDRRGLDLARAIVEKLERGDRAAGVAKARAVNQRWRDMGSSALHDAWADILQGDWESIKSILLADNERGRELRQNNPFCGILTPEERLAIFHEHGDIRRDQMETILRAAAAFGQS